MWLACSRRCGGQLFKALFAEVVIDAGGEYESHRIVEPGYVCLNCGAPAFDLGEVPAAMAEEAAEDAAPPPSADILCPVCETMVAVSSDMECPNCGALVG